MGGVMGGVRSGDDGGVDGVIPAGSSAEETAVNRITETAATG